MQKAVQVQKNLYTGEDGDLRSLRWTYAVSLFGHVVLLGFFLFSPGFHKTRTLPGAAITVSMVSLPTDGTNIQSAPSESSKIQQPKIEKPKTKKAAIVKKKPIETKPSKKAVALAPPKKVKAKTSLKKKTFKPQKAIKRAITDIEKQVKDAPPPQLSNKFEQLRQQVRQAEQNQKRPAAGSGSSRMGAVGRAGGGGARALELLDIYKVEIAFRVQRHWAFPESFAGGEADLVAELAFKVRPDGQIADVWFDRRSGNKHLDESAEKAILKANPVAPHPAGIRKSYITIGLRFTPEGVR